ncbi:hypothetical protein HK098_001579 [Nowakowskiella sp. JEL0407]|nr:hypothetical protein HK098_001579 [Nowakowskiella sp. JEL0407]
MSKPTIQPQMTSDINNLNEDSEHSVRQPLLHFEVGELEIPPYKPKSQSPPPYETAPRVTADSEMTSIDLSREALPQISTLHDDFKMLHDSLGLGPKRFNQLRRQYRICGWISFVLILLGLAGLSTMIYLIKSNKIPNFNSPLNDQTSKSKISLIVAVSACALLMVMGIFLIAMNWYKQKEFKSWKTFDSCINQGLFSCSSPMTDFWGCYGHCCCDGKRFRTSRKQNRNRSTSASSCGDCNCTYSGFYCDDCCNLCLAICELFAHCLQFLGNCFASCCDGGCCSGCGGCDCGGCDCGGCSF